MRDAILLIDDEEQVLNSIQRSLFEENYDVVTSTNGEEGLQRLQEQPFKVVVCDERMPGLSGSETLAMIGLRHPQVVRILLTGQATLEAALRAVNEGQVYRLLLKPWNDMELKMALRSAVEKHDLEMENRRLLSLVRIQALHLDRIERAQPGLAGLKKGRDGRYYLPEIDDEEAARIFGSAPPG